MTISKEALDELLSGVENADDLLGDQGVMKELKVRLPYLIPNKVLGTQYAHWAMPLIYQSMTQSPVHPSKRSLGPNGMLPSLRTF